MKNSRLSPTVYFVVPCYNEEEVLPQTSKVLRDKLNSLVDAGQASATSRIMFITDMPKDKTWTIIEQLHNSDQIFCGVNLSRRVGQQNALYAAMMLVNSWASTNIVEGGGSQNNQLQFKDSNTVAITMDADLQDDIDVIDEMLEKYTQGSDIVYGVRDDRSIDSWTKRVPADAFYKVMNMLGAETIKNHGEFRLLSHRALNALSQFKEVNLFLRGLVPLIGFSQTSVYYKRAERFAGETNYNFRRSLSLAIEGITSFSVKPIRLIAATGLIFAIVSLIAAIVFVIQYILGLGIPGWATTVVSIWIIGGIQLFAIGVIGEYIGKIYLETKERPRYIVDKILFR